MIKNFVFLLLSATSVGFTWAADTIVPGSILPLVTDGKFNAFGDICLTKDNRLLVVYRQGPRFDGNNAAVRQLVSTDFGKSFASATTIYQDPKMDSRDLSLTQLSDGRVACTFFKEAVPHAGRVFIMYSSDYGRTWGSPAQVPTPNLTGFAGCSARLVERNDGVYLLPVYGKVSGDSTERAELYQSSDKGLTWSLLTTVAGTGRDSRWTEHYIGYLADGATLLDLLRNDTAQALYRSTSTNGGLTWTRPVPVSFSSYFPSRPAWTRFPSSNTIVIVYRRRPAFPAPGPPGYALSFDSGVTWTGNPMPFGAGGFAEYGGIIPISPSVVAAAVFFEPMGFYTAGENGTRADAYFQTLIDKSSPPLTPAPQLWPPPGTYHTAGSGNLRLGLYSALPNARIRITVDGTTPTPTYGTVLLDNAGYQDSVVVTSLPPSGTPWTIKAIAYDLSGALLPSAVVTAVYSVDSSADPAVNSADPVIQPSAGSYNMRKRAQSGPIGGEDFYNVCSINPLAQFRATVDGTDPDFNTGHGVLFYNSGVGASFLFFYFGYTQNYVVKVRAKVPGLPQSNVVTANMTLVDM